MIKLLQALRRKIQILKFGGKHPFESQNSVVFLRHCMLSKFTDFIPKHC